MSMDWIRKVPPSVLIAVIISAGISVLGIVGGFVALTIAGQPTDDYRAFVNTLANLLTLPLSGTAVVASVAAAKSANRADVQTNGALSERDEENARLRAQLISLGQKPGGQA